MKNKMMALAAVAAVAAGLSAFTIMADGSIKGKVTPADGAAKVMAVSGADTVKADVSGGSFELSHLKPGTYTLIVDATDPYKDAMKDGVQVTDGIATDVGEIQLQK